MERRSVYTGAANPKHKFTGQESDDSTKLYYYNARYYDPQLGRFITADPTIQRPADPQDFNRYAYCRNNPIRFTDPTGLGWFKKLISAIVGAVVGTVTFLATGNYQLAFKTGVSAYRATEAILNGANIKETITAGINGFGEGDAILRNPQRIGSLLGDPVTDRLTPDGKRALNNMLRNIGLDAQSAKYVGRALEGSLTNGNRNFATIAGENSSSFSLDNYFGASVTYGILGQDNVISKGGVKQKATTFAQLYSASFDVSFGFLPPNNVLTVEMGMGLSKNFSVGLIMAQPNQFDSFDYMGIAAHFGPPSPGSPVYISATQPAKEEKRVLVMDTTLIKG